MRWMRSTSGLLTRKVNWVLNLDIRVSSTPSTRLAGQVCRARIAGPAACVRLIQKCAERRRAGEGKRLRAEEERLGAVIAAPGEPLSPLRVRSVGSAMASEADRGRCDHRAVADDIVVGFQSRTDAERFRQELSERLAKFR